MVAYPRTVLVIYSCLQSIPFVQMKADICFSGCNTELI